MVEPTRGASVASLDAELIFPPEPNYCIDGHEWEQQDDCGCTLACVDCLATSSSCCDHEEPS